MLDHMNTPEAFSVVEGASKTSFLSDMGICNASIVLECLISAIDRSLLTVSMFSGTIDVRSLTVTPLADSPCRISHEFWGRSFGFGKFTTKVTSFLAEDRILVNISLYSSTERTTLNSSNGTPLTID